MKVKITKAGRYADSAPHLPQATVKEGEERDDLSDFIAQTIIDTGRGIAMDETETETEEETETKKDNDVRAELEGLITGTEDKKEQKQKLEEWARQKLDIEVDRRSNVSDIIDMLVEEAAK
jgi:hypothetical protein